MKYTLDKRIEHPLIPGLYRVKKDGDHTSVWASENVIFSDKCAVHGGEFHGGEFHGGEFHGGVFLGGVFRGGVFRGGLFRGGLFHRGLFRGGLFHGGVFLGGVFHGGVFLGGVFLGGVFRGGWLPVQIQGSRHMVNCPDGETIQIGCKNSTPEEWKRNFESIGKGNNYTDSEIAEYKLYIDLISKMIKNNLTKVSQ